MGTSKKNFLWRIMLAIWRGQFNGENTLNASNVVIVLINNDSKTPPLPRTIYLLGEFSDFSNITQ